MAEAFIQIKDLVKTFDTPAGPLNVLRGINLEINKGDFIALLGPSGSGKTTFLNMLTAVDTPTGGEIVIGGVPITQVPQRRLTKWRARNVGIVFQFFQLLPTLTVVENVIAPMDFANVWKPRERREVATKLLDRFGIADQAFKTPDMLSGGQQQRVALARALANNPPLVVGDEPTGNLDRMSANNVFDLFRSLADRGTTVIMVTHDRELVKSVPKVLELVDGTIGETTLAAAAARRTQELRATRTRLATRGAFGDSSCSKRVVVKSFATVIPQRSHAAGRAQHYDRVFGAVTDLGERPDHQPAQERHQSRRNRHDACTSPCQQRAPTSSPRRAKTSSWRWCARATMERPAARHRRITQVEGRCSSPSTGSFPHERFREASCWRRRAIRRPAARTDALTGGEWLTRQNQVAIEAA